MKATNDIILAPDKLFPCYFACGVELGWVLVRVTTTWVMVAEQKAPAGPLQFPGADSPLPRRTVMLFTVLD